MADLDAIRERVNTEDTWTYGDSGEAHADARVLLALLDEAVELLIRCSSNPSIWKAQWVEEPGSLVAARAFLVRLGRDQ